MNAEFPRRLSQVPELRTRMEGALFRLVEEVWDEESLLACGPLTAGTAQRVAVTGKLWLLQSPHEPVKVAVKSALSVSVPM